MHALLAFAPHAARFDLRRSTGWDGLPDHAGPALWQPVDPEKWFGGCLCPRRCCPMWTGNPPQYNPRSGNTAWMWMARARDRSISEL